MKNKNKKVIVKRKGKIDIVINGKNLADADRNANKRICFACGASLPSNTKICTECGTELNKT